MKSRIFETDLARIGLFITGLSGDGYHASGHGIERISRLHSCLCRRPAACAAKWHDGSNGEGPGISRLFLPRPIPPAHCAGSRMRRGTEPVPVPASKPLRERWSTSISDGPFWHFWYACPSCASSFSSWPTLQAPSHVVLLHSPPRRGGVARSAGVVRSAQTFRRTDHPVCASFHSAHPPLLCEEGNSSVERFDLDDRRAMVVADPERAGILRIIDVNPADVGRARQHVLRVLAALDIEPRHTIRQHGTGPSIAVAIEHGVVRRAPRCRHLPFLHAFGFWIEHADRVALIFTKPQPALGIDTAAPRSRVGCRCLIDRRDFGLRVDLHNVAC